MRHGKSDWANALLTDFDRPLNERGEKASKTMAKQIIKLKVAPDIILSSPALRAKSTAKIIAKQIDYKEEIIYIEEFYFGFRDNIIKNIQNLPDSINSALVIGHNPTWENLVTSLVIENVSVTMPTASMVYLSADINNWVNFRLKSCHFEWILCPKDLDK